VIFYSSGNFSYFGQYRPEVMIRLATVPAVSVASTFLHRDDHLMRALIYGYSRSAFRIPFKTSAAPMVGAE
jgi:hypothetical protein